VTYNFPPCFYLVTSCLAILACPWLCPCLALSSCPVYALCPFPYLCLCLCPCLCPCLYLRLGVFIHPCLCLRQHILSCLIFTILNKPLKDLAQLRQVHSNPYRNTHRKPNSSSTPNPNACHRPNQVHGSRLRTHFLFFLPLLAGF
jgi:hypothetical protein